MSSFFKKFEEIKAQVQEAISSPGSNSQYPGQQAGGQQGGQPPNSLGVGIPGFPKCFPPLRPYWIANFDPAKPVSDEWRHETGAGGWGNAELENYTDQPANSFFTPMFQGPNSPNILVLRAIAQGDNFTSARLTSRGQLGRSRGYLQARIKAPCARGIWPAFWLLPKEPFSWPKDGEVDIMESWNTDPHNHSCLHWGQFNGPDHDKHRVVDTHMPALPEYQYTYGFAWDQKSNGSGMLVWYIDGKAVMKAKIPGGIRRLEEFEVKLNIAMGGNVMQGVKPEGGTYDMVVFELGFFEEPHGGWQKFERDCKEAAEGHMM